jgi:hypothetical protein
MKVGACMIIVMTKRTTSKQWMTLWVFYDTISELYLFYLLEANEGFAD